MNKIEEQDMEIKENAVYTTQEAQRLLKVSPSTTMRLIKKGIIRTAKVGKQYRIMGKELLRILSPELEDKVGRIYNKGRRWLHKGIDV
ncbi:MAG: helix-turn-helix domain-containing protein [Candidatus Omnitrophica bacterium]|nr:helix-turn-helix domain-containing protein [Candidatus Omnitrophota bacterium]